MGSITDVPGVRVGHLTLGGPRSEDPSCDPGVRTGVTCVLPGRRDVLADPVTAAVQVINGYGKPLGLAQVAELGQLETPIILTSTLSVGTAHEGVIRHLLGRHPHLGRPETVNPVVLECNDGWLNDLRALAVRPEHVVAAIEGAEAQPDGHPVEQGAVGAGHGMVAFGWKGGIGTASRRVGVSDEGQVGGADARRPAPSGTLGALVLTNMGRPEDFTPRSGVRSAGAGSTDAGEPGGRARSAGDDGGWESHQPRHTGGSDGSVIVLLATDAALDARQLGRLARRAQNGLARTGALTDHGSGEFVVAFTIAEPSVPRRDGDWLRPWFAAVADVVEEAVLSSMREAHTVTGRDGLTVERCPAL